MSAAGESAAPQTGAGFQAAWDRVVAWSSVEKCLIGASVFRIVAGATFLIQMLINYGQRHYLFGPDAAWPWRAMAENPSLTRFLALYSWSDSLLYFEVVYHLGLAAGALWMVGWRTRILTPLTFIFWWSAHQRFPGIWDGGDNLMQLVFIYGSFANLGAHFSLDAKRLAGRPTPPWMAMLHNAAMLAFGAQISLVYVVAGLYKVQGETWREGTAIYYSFRGGQFVWPGVSEHFYQSAFASVSLSYITVFFQLSFPYMMALNRYTRTAAVCIGVMFHLGIALFFGLITFSFYMMSVDLALLGDREYQAIFRFIRRTKDRLAASFTRQAALSPAAAPDSTHGKEDDAPPNHSPAIRSEAK